MTTMVKSPPPVRRYRPLSIGAYERLRPAARNAYDHAEELYLRERLTPASRRRRRPRDERQPRSH